MKTWETVVTNVVAWGIFFPAGLFALVWFLGGSVETLAEHSEQHDRCLKQAINGYEIRKCR